MSVLWMSFDKAGIQMLPGRTACQYAWDKEHGINGPPYPTRRRGLELMTISDHSEEFDCIECGRHIIRIIATMKPPVCAECVHMPDWFRDAELRAMLDPEMDVSKIPEHER